MKKLIGLIDILESKLPYSDLLESSVSQTSVGWHIEHSVLVASQIIYAVENSDPKAYSRKFNLNRLFVFTLNRIPRGRGKAPKAVQPKGDFEKDKVIKDFETLREKLPILNSLHHNSYFLHPYFGNLNLKATMKMLKLHTKHHLDIIDDIIKKGRN